MSAAPLHMISKHRSNGPINYGSTIIPWTQTKPVWLTSLHRQTEDPTLKHCAMVFFQSLLGQTTRFFPLVLVSFVLASFWGLLPNPYWCLKPCFSHECHANVLTDICPFETNWWLTCNIMCPKARYILPSITCNCLGSTRMSLLFASCPLPFIHFFGKHHNLSISDITSLCSSLKATILSLWP